jgi:hypothetical protein
LLQKEAGDMFVIVEESNKMIVINVTCIKNHCLKLDVVINGNKEICLSVFVDIQEHA